MTFDLLIERFGEFFFLYENIVPLLKYFFYELLELLKRDCTFQTLPRGLYCC